MNIEWMLAENNDYLKKISYKFNDDNDKWISDFRSYSTDLIPNEDSTLM